MSGHCFVKSAIVLLTLGNYYEVRGVIGIINIPVKYHKALKGLCHIFCLKMLFIIFIHILSIYLII